MRQPPPKPPGDVINPTLARNELADFMETVLSLQPGDRAEVRMVDGRIVWEQCKGTAGAPTAPAAAPTLPSSQLFRSCEELQQVTSLADHHRQAMLRASDGVGRLVDGVETELAEIAQGRVASVGLGPPVRHGDGSVPGPGDHTATMPEGDALVWCCGSRGWGLYVLSGGSLVSLRVVPAGARIIAAGAVGRLVRQLTATSNAAAHSAPVTEPTKPAATPEVLPPLSESCDLDCAECDAECNQRLSAAALVRRMTADILAEEGPNADPTDD